MLFNLYINNLSIRVTNSDIGGTLDNRFVNHMMYADDLCIVSLSSSGLQELLNMCTDYCDLHDIMLNAKKFVCLFFWSLSTNVVLYQKFLFMIQYVNFSNEVRYQGVMISSSMKTTIDVKRQTRTFYAQANLLIRNFRHCTDKVKCYLFQSYCTSMYCSQLWFNSTKDSLHKPRTSYNTALRRLLCISFVFHL